MQNKFDHTYKSKLESIVADTSFQDRDWHALNKRLNKKEKRRRKIYIFSYIAVGVLLFSLISLGIFAYKINPADIEKSNASNVVTQIPTVQCGDLSLLPLPMTLLSYVEEQTYSKNKAKENKSAPINLKNIIKITPVPNTSNNDGRYFNLATENSLVHNNIVSKEPFSKLEENTPFQNYDLKAPDTLQSHSIVEIPRLNIGINYIALPHMDLHLSQKVSKSSNFGIKFSYGKFYDIFPKISHAGNLSHVEESVQMAPLGNSLQSNLVYSYKDKYRFSLGLHHASLAFDAYHKMNIKADELTIHDPSMDSQRSYNINYNISDGKINSSLLVSFFDVAPGQHNYTLDSFDFSMKINKTIKTLSIPLLIERKLLNKNNFNAYLQVGSSLNYRYKVKTQIISSNETCKELCLINGFEPMISSVMSSSSTLTVDGLLGLALEYKLSPRLSIGLNPQSSISFINPANLKRYELSTYVFYHFNK